MPEVRLIDANALIGFLHNQIFIDGDDRSLVYKWIEDQPTIEPEVRHGRWIELPKALNSEENPCKCSACGHILSFYGYYPKSKYCPNCGAKMDGGIENG